MSGPSYIAPKGVIGERVCIREHVQCTGTVNGIDDRGGWLSIAWDKGCSGPKLCHESELFALSVDGSEKICV